MKFVPTRYLAAILNFKMAVLNVYNPAYLSIYLCVDNLCLSISIKVVYRCVDDLHYVSQF